MKKRFFHLIFRSFMSYIKFTHKASKIEQFLSSLCSRHVHTYFYLRKETNIPSHVRLNGERHVFITQISFRLEGSNCNVPYKIFC